MNKSKYWQLQKAANLSNAQAAEYLGVNKSTVVRWRNGSSEVPKAVILALTAYIGGLNETNNNPTQEQPALTAKDSDNASRS